VSKPIAVLISDIHYSLPTLELADKSLKMAVHKANDLNVQLIIAGDLHDTKANLRGECVNAMIGTLSQASRLPYILIGNHDKINEKSEDHSLNFLHPHAEIIEDYSYIDTFSVIGTRIRLLPYFSDVEELKKITKSIPNDHIVIMHQGIQGSDAGHYIKDPTALAQADVAGLRVISGHYHRRQDITLPDGGLWSYIGNPYSLNFGEANDPEKGFRILNDDGTLDFVPTNLRKHVTVEYTPDKREYSDRIGPNDLVQVKVKGPKQWVSSITKQVITEITGIEQDFKLDLIPTDETIETEGLKNLSQVEVLDGLIDRLPEHAAKDALKALWRSLNEAAKGNGQ
jgi:hypothetical protein